MMRVLAAGSLYFALVFAAGFVLGTLRVLLLVPSLGEGAAVAVELPLMLAISWVAAGWIIHRVRLPARRGARLAMGAFAFALLLGAEAALSVALFGRTLPAHLAHYATWPGALGLAGQGGFALIPLIRLWRPR